MPSSGCIIRNFSIIKNELTCLYLCVLYQCDRSDGYGGVLLVFSDNLNVTENTITNYHECEIVACTLTYKHQKIISSSIYRPPSADISYTQNLCNILEEMVASKPNTPLWIGGDLNLITNIDWTNSSILNNRYPMALCNNIMLNNIMLDTMTFLYSKQHLRHIPLKLSIICNIL